MSNIRQKLRGIGFAEVADAASQEQQQQAITILTTRCHFVKTIEVFAFEAYDFDTGDVAKFALKKLVAKVDPPETVPLPVIF